MCVGFLMSFFGSMRFWGFFVVKCILSIKKYDGGYLIKKEKFLLYIWLENWLYKRVINLKKEVLINVLIVLFVFYIFFVNCFL